MDGSHLKGYVDDNLIFDEIDNGALFSGNLPVLIQGKAGIRVANQAARIDDFLVTELTDDVVVVPPVETPVPFSIEGQLNRSNGLSASVLVSRTANAADHPGTEVVLFQLLKGTTPVSYVAMESEIGAGNRVVGHFDVADPENMSYHVHAFVVSSWDLLNESLPLSLSNKLNLE